MVYNNHLSRLNLSRIEPMPVRNYIVDIRDLIARINSFRVAFHPIKNEIHSIIIRRERYIYIMIVRRKLNFFENMTFLSLNRNYPMDWGSLWIVLEEYPF